jgi:hypothetical protein
MKRRSRKAPRAIRTEVLPKRRELGHTLAVGKPQWNVHWRQTCLVGVDGQLRTIRMSSIDYGPENSQLWAKKIELDSRIFVLKQQRRWLAGALVVALMILALVAALRDGNTPPGPPVNEAHGTPSSDRVPADLGTAALGR